LSKSLEFQDHGISKPFYLDRKVDEGDQGQSSQRRGTNREHPGNEGEPIFQWLPKALAYVLFT